MPVPRGQGQSSQRTLLFIVLSAWLLCVALAAVSPAGAQAEEIDRLLVSVNGKVITKGDLLLARELNAILAEGKDHAAPSGTEEINRLINLELMRQELANFPMAAEDEGQIQTRVQELEKAYEPTGGLSALVQARGLQESELLGYLRLQDSILRFIDFRFRPFVNVEGQEIQKYYEEELVPPLRKAGSQIPPLSDVSGKIEEILKEEHVNTALNQWIEDVRRHSRIEYFLDGAEPPWVKNK